MALDQLNPRRAIDGIRDAVTDLIAATDRKWGHGRLRLLVPDDLRERFEVQCLKFETALRAGEILAVRRQAAGVRVGLSALERVARQAGHEPLAPEVWTVTLDDGTHVALVRTQAENLAVCDGYAEVYTAQDIGRLIAARPELRQIKRNFAGAEIAGIQPAPKSDFDWSVIASRISGGKSLDVRGRRMSSGPAMRSAGSVGPRRTCRTPAPLDHESRPGHRGAAGAARPAPGRRGPGAPAVSALALPKRAGGGRPPRRCAEMSREARAGYSNRAC